MKTHEYWMNKALELAERAGVCREVPVGAVLVNDHEVIGYGFNEKESRGETLAHAEMRALLSYNHMRGSWRLPADTILYVTLEPCLMCVGALLAARLDHVVYACQDPKQAAMSALKDLIDSGRFDHRFKSVVQGIGELGSQKLLKKFFKELRKSK